MFNTFNQEFNEFSFDFDYNNQVHFDFDNDLYIPKDWNKSLHDSLALTEIKSTEEISQKNESCSLKNFAEENNIICKEVWKPAFELKLEDWTAINNLISEIRAKINSSSIDQLIEEVIDIQACVETDFRDNLIIQTKQKKSNIQKDVLENKLKETPVWNTEYMNKIANELGLKTRQVYKWYWDRTKKRANEESNRKIKKTRNSKFEDIEAAFGIQL